MIKPLNISRDQSEAHCLNSESIAFAGPEKPVSDPEALGYPTVYLPLTTSNHIHR